jgi:hypothetical protein
MAHSKKTPRVVGVILAMLRTGCTHRAAYGMACISRETFYAWMRDDPIFSANVREAEAVAEAYWLQQAVAEGKNFTKLLSLRFRDDWGEQLKIEHAGGVQVAYVNNWRGPASVSAQGTANSTIPGVEVQLVSGRPAVAEDNDVHVDSGGGGADG